MSLNYENSEAGKRHGGSCARCDKWEKLDDIKMQGHITDDKQSQT